MKMGTRLKNTLTLLFLTLVLLPWEVKGQCCAAGNPVGNDLLAAAPDKNQLSLNTRFRHSFSEQYFEKDHRVEMPQVNYSRYNYQSIQVKYGLLEKLSVHSELGYFYDKTQSLSIQGGRALKGRGIGDWALGLQYQFLKRDFPSREGGLSIGIKLPVGVFDQENDGVVLPLSLQPSNGAIKYTTSIYYIHNARRWSTRVSAGVDICSEISSGNFFYQYGNIYIFSMAESWRAGKNWQLGLQAQVEARAKDRREDRITVESSGSVVLFLMPFAQYSFYGDWFVTSMVEIPAYKYVNGLQLTNKYGFSLGIGKKFTGS